MNSDELVKRMKWNTWEGIDAKQEEFERWRTVYLLITDDKDLNISDEKKDALIGAIQNWGTALVLREKERVDQAK